MIVMKIVSGILHLLHCLDYVLFLNLFTLGLKINTNDMYTCAWLCWFWFLMVPLGLDYMSNALKEAWRHMGKPCGNFVAMKE
jgi:hypothetical protein